MVEEIKGNTTAAAEETHRFIVDTIQSARHNALERRNELLELIKEYEATVAVWRDTISEINDFLGDATMSELEVSEATAYAPKTHNSEETTYYNIDPGFGVPHSYSKPSPVKREQPKSDG